MAIRFKPSRARYGGICEWTERNIRIARSDARPGAVRLTGYQRGILDAYADAGVQQVTLMLPSQSGKTLSVLMMMAYSMINRPSVMMMASPREDDSARFIDDKFAPLYENNPSVRERVRRGWSRRGIKFDGGMVRFAHAGSDASMKSTSASAVFADEVDEYPIGSVNADHPLDILRQRLVTFGKAGTLVVLSTPTDRETSVVASEYDAGSRGEYITSCPACGCEQGLGEGNAAAGVLDALFCGGCGGRIGEGERLAMIRGGFWRHEEPANPNRSFHMSQFSSPLVDVERSLYDRSRASKRGWTTQGLALPYEWDESESVTEDAAAGLLADGAPFERTRFDGASVGVDVQKDRIEYTVLIWRMAAGEPPMAHVSEHRGIAYNPDDALDFQSAFGFLWERLHGVGGLERVFVDCGYRTQDVKTAVARAPFKGLVYACMGHDYNRSGGAAAGEDFVVRRYDGIRKAAWYLVDSHRAKTFAADIIGEGWITAQRDALPADWTKQMASERMKMVRTARGGRTKPAWVKVYPRNEAWDCFVYALAAHRQYEMASLADKRMRVG